MKVETIRGIRAVLDDNSRRMMNPEKVPLTPGEGNACQVLALVLIGHELAEIGVSLAAISEQIESLLERK